MTSVQPERRGSEPALLQAEAMSRQECSRSEMAVHVPNPQLNAECKAAVIAEEQSQGIYLMGDIDFGLYFLYL